MALLTASNVQGEVWIVIGTSQTSVYLKRIKSVLENGGKVVVIGAKQALGCVVDRFHSDENFQCLDRSFQLSDLTTLGRIAVGKVVDKVLLFPSFVDQPLAEQVYAQCVKLRIPINTFQRAEYSTFHMVSTYTEPTGSGLQIAVTTNGQGCLLANRIKREVVSALPSNIAAIVTNMGQLRNEAVREDYTELRKNFCDNIQSSLCYGSDEDGYESHDLNKLINEFNISDREKKLQRSRWLSQVLTYYPLASLADITLSDLQYAPSEQHIVKNPAQLGSIALVGSGPGSVSMLTIGALHEIKEADLVLVDKLVPQDIQALIPASAETFIARKFPGNAENAQQELLEKGLEAVKNGKRVVRLKQGDPYIFGRGGEEFAFFKENGITPRVLPGLSSSLASTVVADIPATQRNIADEVLICTGTGKKGALPRVPEYRPSRTTIFLMALHRVDLLVHSMVEAKWDADAAVAVVERASCTDQRVTRTKLKYLVQVVKEIGSRPPGLLVFGNAVDALVDTGARTCTEDARYIVNEGYDNSAESLAIWLQHRMRL